MILTIEADDYTRSCLRYSTLTAQMVAAGIQVPAGTRQTGNGPAQQKMHREVQQSDALLQAGDIMASCLASDLNGTTSRVASGKNWVHQQHMALRNVPWQLLINQLLLNNSVTDLADAPAFAWGVPIQPIGCTVLGSWVMPAVCSFTLAKQKDAYT